LKCAVSSIGALVIAVAVCQFLEIFYQLLNDNIDWWYVLVGVLLSVPLIIALAFGVCFFNEETDSSRRLLRTALLLTIISLTLAAIWNAVYFWFFYHHAEIVTGNDGVGYTKATKKQEIVFSAYFALVADCFFAYFICVLTNYIDGHREAQINMMLYGDFKGPLNNWKAKVPAKDEEAAKPLIEKDTDNKEEKAAPTTEEEPAATKDDKDEGAGDDNNGGE